MHATITFKKRMTAYVSLSMALFFLVSYSVHSTSKHVNYFSANVISITDGDTIKVLRENDDESQQIKIRLYGIDTPEKKQAYGKATTRHLKKILCNPVTVETYKKDRYGRTIGVLWCGEENINMKMVADGYAWAYRRYLSPKSKKETYVALENTARQAQLGLWNDPTPVAPWDYRRAKRNKNK